MKLYRYMSEREFQLLTAGVEIVGKRHFDAYTDSEGICFLGEKTSFIDESYDDEKDMYVQEEHSFSPVECISFLSGIVSDDAVLVELETDAPVRKSAGVYANPLASDWDALIDITEYCIPSYSLDTFCPLRYALVDRRHLDDTVWYDCHC